MTQLIDKMLPYNTNTSVNRLPTLSTTGSTLFVHYHPPHPLYRLVRITPIHLPLHPTYRATAHPKHLTLPRLIIPRLPPAHTLTTRAPTAAALVITPNTADITLPAATISTFLTITKGIFHRNIGDHNRPIIIAHDQISPAHIHLRGAQILILQALITQINIKSDLKTTQMTRNTVAPQQDRTLPPPTNTSRAATNNINKPKMMNANITRYESDNNEIFSETRHTSSS